jgi:hypothetical protein
LASAKCILLEMFSVLGRVGYIFKITDGSFHDTCLLALYRGLGLLLPSLHGTKRTKNDSLRAIMGLNQVCCNVGAVK